jgi:hypothetical protein
LVVLVVGFAASYAVLAAAMAPGAGSSTGTRISVAVILLLEGLVRLPATSCKRSIVASSLVLGSSQLSHRVRAIELADAKVALKLLSSPNESTAMTRGEKAWVLQDMHLCHWSLNSSVKVRRCYKVACSSELVSD